MSVTTNDPPSAERNNAKFWKWVRVILRKLVNRRTLLLALWVVLWIDRFMRAVKRLLGDF